MTEHEQFLLAILTLIAPILIVLIRQLGAARAYGRELQKQSDMELVRVRVRARTGSRDPLR